MSGRASAVQRNPTLTARHVVHRLVALQWVAALGSVGLFAGVAGLPWGAWLPGGAYVVATGLWGWSAQGRPWIASRAQVRAVAWGAGWRGGALAAVVFGAVGALRPDAMEASAARIALASILILGVGSIGFTGLTLIALDAARPPPQGSSTSEA